MKIAVIAAGVLTGGGFLVWFAKLMAGRFIKQHDDNDRRLRDLEAAVAVLSYRADEIKSDLNKGLKTLREKLK